MNDFPWLIIGGTFLLALLLMSLVRPMLMRLGSVDVPNHRSSHSVPVLRGAGIALAPALLIAVIVLFSFGAHLERLILVGLCLITGVLAATVGAVEDLRGIPAKYRFLLQLTIGVSATFVFIALTASSWWWLPLGAFSIAAYINASNFMDGINGISGLHGLMVGSIFSVVGYLTHETWLNFGGLLVAAVFSAFLPWNLLGGRVFLGDAGSYLLGGVISALAVAAFLAGINPISLLGPVAIYLADVGTTLLRRIRAGERWTEAHRSHVYQRLIDCGFNHVQVATLANGLGLGAGMAGLLALDFGFWGSIAAVTIIGALVITYLLIPKFAQHLIVLKPASTRNSG